jgi:hypothetical protein
MRGSWRFPGITWALFGYGESGSHVGFPYLWRFNGNPKPLARGVLLAVEEIKRIRAEGVTEREFEGARTWYLQGLIPASCGTPQRSTASSGRFAGPERREFLDGENIAAPS